MMAAMDHSGQADNSVRLRPPVAASASSGTNSLGDQLDALMATLQRFRELLPSVSACAQALARCLKAGGKILTCGKGGGLLAGRCDLEILVPSQDTARVQELHTFVLHLWLKQVENELKT